jgi:hypothetical protein
MSNTRWDVVAEAGTRKKRTMVVFEQSVFSADVVLAGEHWKFLFFCTGQKERRSRRSEVKSPRVSIEWQYTGDQ